MAFVFQPGGFAHPRSCNQFFSGEGRLLIVNLMPEYDPKKSLLVFFRCRHGPVCNSDVLHPAEINNVIHMAQLIDIGRHYQDRQLKPASVLCCVLAHVSGYDLRMY